MRKSLLISISIFVFALFLDQSSKTWAQGLSSLRYNQGFIMGYFSDLPDSLRIISLASFSGFIFFVYICFLAIIPEKARFLNYGLSLLTAGIFGNAIDKSVYGMTIDFIPFVMDGALVTFNLADVFLWIGTAIILWMVFHKEKDIWYPDSTRRKYIVRPRDQYKFALILSTVSFCSCVVFGIFSYAFFGTILRTMGPENHRVMPTFFFTFCGLSLLFCSMSFVAGILMSHKTAGPLYAFNLYVNDLLAGNDRKFRLREGDSYRDLESLAEKLRAHFRSKVD